MVASTCLSNVRPNRTSKKGRRKGRLFFGVPDGGRRCGQQMVAVFCFRLRRVEKWSRFFLRFRGVKKWSSCFAVLKKWSQCFAVSKNDRCVSVCICGLRVSLYLSYAHAQTHTLEKDTLASRHGEEGENTLQRQCQMAILWHKTFSRPCLVAIFWHKTS